MSNVNYTMKQTSILLFTILLCILLPLKFTIAQASSIPMEVKSQTVKKLQPNQQPIVWYIPGFLSGDDPQNNAKNILRKIYPSAQSIKNIIWFDTSGSFDIWEKSIELADFKAQELVKEIQEMSPDERQRLILIGHSLGGRIAIRILYELHMNDIQIRQAVLLGAAIDNDDPQISTALLSCQDTVYSFVNPLDKWLRVYHSKSRDSKGQLHSALGTGYMDYPPIEQFCEIAVSPSDKHDSLYYLGQFHANINSLKPNGIVVPQDQPLNPLNLTERNNNISWTTIESYKGWSFCYNKIGVYSIFDSQSLCRASGSKDAMARAFAKVQKQLDNGIGIQNPLLTKNVDKIEIPKNVKVDKTRVNRMEKDWINRDEFNGWLLQSNAKFDEYRIIDPAADCRARGTKNIMQDVFNSIKHQLIEMEE